MLISEKRKVWKWVKDRRGIEGWLRSHVRFLRAGDRIKIFFEETAKEVVLCCLRDPEIRKSDGLYVVKIARY